MVTVSFQADKITLVKTTGKVDGGSGEARCGNHEVAGAKQFQFECHCQNDELITRPRASGYGHALLRVYDYLI